MNFQETSKGNIMDHAGRSVAYFDPKQELFCVKLSGPPVGPRIGPHVWKEGVMYLISASWPETEITRLLSENGLAAAPGSDLGPFTEREKKWLKDHYRSEYHFLRQHGLSIYKEEDREEGRELMRSIMAEDLQ